MREKNTLPRLVASDIGGTLISGFTPLPPFTAQVLNRLVDRGIPVALITGYNFQTTAKLMEPVKEKVYCLPQNGALCLKANEVIWEYRLTAAEVKTMHDYLEKKGLPILVYLGVAAGLKNYYIYQEELPLSYAFDRLPALEDAENITGISTLVPDAQAPQIRADLQSISGGGLKVIYTREKRGSFLEVVHAEVRKDAALKKMCRLLDVPLERVIFFGDNLNDLEALRLVKEPVIVAGAVPELKAEFTVQVGPPEEEGVAHYLCQRFNLDERPGPIL